MAINGSEIPESKLQALNQGIENAPVNIQSSESDESDDEDRQPDINGYQPLPTDGGFEISTDEDEDDGDEIANEEPPQPSSNVSSRSLEVDTSLVLNTMKSIKLTPTAIPRWAKGMTDLKWNELIGKVQEDGTISPTATNESSSQM